MSTKLASAAVVVSAIAACPLSGCANRYFADRSTNPVIEDYINHGDDGAGLGVMSTTASRRNVYIQLKPEGAIGKICAEPPPDVGEAFAKSFAASVETGEIKGGLASSAATSIAPLLYRSQGLQLYRDSVSHLCFMYMNGVIKEAEFFAEEKAARQQADGLIRYEIEKKPAFVAPAGATAPQVTTTIKPPSAAPEVTTTVTPK